MTVPRIKPSFWKDGIRFMVVVESRCKVTLLTVPFGWISYPNFGE